jgi:hypothetical protein
MESDAAQLVRRRRSAETESCAETPESVLSVALMNGQLFFKRLPAPADASCPVMKLMPARLPEFPLLQYRHRCI